MIAGIASHLAKPRGVAYVPPGDEERFIGPLPIEELTGVGHKTARQFHDMNIRTVEQLRIVPRETLRALLGLRGEAIYERCRGRDVSGKIYAPPPDEDCGATRTGASKPPNEQVGSPHHNHRPPPLGFARGGERVEPRSISRETTFHHSQCDGAQIRGMLFYLLERSTRAARKADLLAGCVEVSIRYDDWKSDVARRKLDEPTDADDVIFVTALELLDRLHKRRVALRHIGLTLSNLTHRDGQGKLFETNELSPKWHARTGHESHGRLARVNNNNNNNNNNKNNTRGETPLALTGKMPVPLYDTLDAIRDRFGHAAVVVGKSIELLGHLEQNDYGFVLRTPSLTK